MTLRSLTLSVVALGVSAAPLLGQSVQSAQTYYGYEDANFQTSFRLDFPALGISSSSRVFYTRFKLDIDEDAGKARFVSYEQEIEPLTLPLGISTGTLRVRIQNSDGTYNAATGAIKTNDDYNITFTNDLSAFGFESPVVLPAVSEGTITTEADGSRYLEMQWQGDGELANSENPSEPYKFTYTCKTRSRVVESQAAVPALPVRDTCGTGLAALFGAGFVGLVGTRYRVRRRRR